MSYLSPTVSYSVGFWHRKVDGVYEYTVDHAQYIWWGQAYADYFYTAEILNLETAWITEWKDMRGWKNKHSLTRKQGDSERAAGKIMRRYWNWRRAQEVTRQLGVTDILSSGVLRNLTQYYFED